MIVRPLAALLLTLSLPNLIIAQDTPVTPAPEQPAAAQPETPAVVTPEQPAKPEAPGVVTPAQPAKPVPPPVVTPEPPAKPVPPPVVTPEPPAKPEPPARPPVITPEKPEPPAPPVVEPIPVNPEPAPSVKFYIDPLNADADFPFQGEYTGTLGGQRVGLQVVAQGNGQFIATEYRGGLPGDGWDGSTRIKYTGSLENGSVTLTAENRQVVVNATGTGTLVGESPQATLQKVDRKSPTLGLPAPSYATVLFDGTNADAFVNGQLENDLLLPGTEFKDSFKNYRLHLEFMTPYMPFARGQARGNSGVYLQSRYEVQILDSFGLDGLDNEAGALYKLVPPKVNMAYPPLTWQTYDIDFQGALFDYDGNKVRPARLTVWHNGVKVHDALDIPAKTGAGVVEGPDPLPIKLQDHGNPVRFRNIWVIDYDKPGLYDPTPTQVFAPEAYYGVVGPGGIPRGYLVAQWPIYPFYPMYPYGQSVYPGVTPILDHYGPSTQPYIYPTNWWHRFGYYPYQGVEFHHYPHTGWNPMHFNAQIGVMTPTGTPVPGWQPIYFNGAHVYPHYRPIQ